MIQLEMLLNVFFVSGGEGSCTGPSGLKATMPNQMEALSGTCLQIPCSFDFIPPNHIDNSKPIFGLWLKSGTDLRSNPEFVVFNSSQNNYKHPITIIGNLSENNCTTVFTNMNSSYADVYYFRVENRPFMSTDPCNPLTFTVKDSAPAPSIQTPPEGALTEGSRVTFTCRAIAPCPSEPPLLTWNQSGGPEGRQEPHGDQEPNVRTRQLNITLSDRHDGVRLTCLAEYPLNVSAGGPSVRTAESVVTLNVSYSPKDTQASVSPPTVSLGGVVNLTCTSRANPPVLRFTWFRSSGEGPLNVSHGSLYSFKMSSNNETYYCVATNPLGNQTSPEIKLTIGDSAPAPSIQTPPEGALTEGSRVTFTCRAIAPCPTEPPLLTWNQSGGPEGRQEPHGDQEPNVRTRQLNITLSDRHDGVRLTCLAEYPLKVSAGGPSVRTAESVVTLHVSYSPKDTQASVSPPTVSLGGVVNLTCTSRANPPVLRFTWFRSSGEGPLNVSHGSLYSFKMSSNKEIYYCVATNPLGNQTSPEIKLTIGYSAPAPSIQTPPEGALTEGSRVTFTCRAIAPCPTEPPLLTWNQSGGPEGRQEPHGDQEPNVRTRQLNITLSDRHDGVRLTCLAEYPLNVSAGGPSVRTAESVVTLHVSYSPKDTHAFVSPPTVSLGGVVNLTCTSRANPPVLRFTWFRSSGEGPLKVSHGSLYSFKMSSNNETYYCVATNPLGNQTSPEIKLTIGCESVGLSLFYGNPLFTLFLQVIDSCIHALPQNPIYEASDKQVEEEIHYGEIDFTKRGAVQNPGLVFPQGEEQTSEYVEVTAQQAKNARIRAELEKH
ncbi:unnamed protein product [Lota lota]